MSVQSTYNFKARTSSGSIVTGTMVAESADEVCAKLRTEGKFVLNVDDRALRAEVTLDGEQIRRSETARQIKRDDVIAFCQQLAVMLETGVPLTEALDSFAAQTPRRAFRSVLGVVREALYGGEQFSTAIARWPRVFPTLMVSLMKASEASGTMSMMLGRIGIYLAKERKIKRQVRGALGYPLFMMGCGVAMTVFLVAVVLPKFAKIYESRAATLPAPTRVLLGVSEFVTTQYVYYVPSLLIAVVVGTLFFTGQTGRRLIDTFKLRCPILREFFGQVYLTQVTQTMATLMAAGVNLLDIIDLCRGVTKNVHYAELWDAMERDVRDGRQMSDTLARCTFISPNVRSMIASGERAGRLALVMERIAEFSEQELEISVKRITSMIEPVMIIFMGVVIGGLAIALLLPIFSMGQVMTGQG